MKSFRFRPEALLEIRRRRRDALQAALGLAQRTLAEAETELHRRTAQRDEALRAYRDAVDVDPGFETHERHRNWIARLRAGIAAQESAVEARRAEMAAAAERLRVAHQEVRVLERLKEHQRRRYDDAVRKEELKEMDQIASLRYARQLMEGQQHGD